MTLWLAAHGMPGRRPDAGRFDVMTRAREPARSPRSGRPRRPSPRALLLRRLAWASPDGSRARRPRVARRAWLRVAPGRVRRRRGPHAAGAARARADALLLPPALVPLADRARARRSRAARRSCAARAYRRAAVSLSPTSWFASAPRSSSASRAARRLWAGAAVARAVAARGQIGVDFAVAAVRGCGRRSGSPLAASWRLRLGLSRRRAAHAGGGARRRGRPPTPSASPRCCRSPRCSPCSPASARGRIENALELQPHGRSRASSGCSRSSRTRPT